MNWESLKICYILNKYCITNVIGWKEYVPRGCCNSLICIAILRHQIIQLHDQTLPCYSVHRLALFVACYTNDISHFERRVSYIERHLCRSVC